MSASLAFLFAKLRRHAAPGARLLMLLVALFYGWAAFANVVSVSHDPVAVAMHADHGSVVVAGAGGEHGHRHDDPDDPDGREHQHGHNAADHSHEKQNLTTCTAPPGLRGGQCWVPTREGLPPPAPVFAFERPPRSVPQV